MFKKGIIAWNKGKKTGLIPKTAFKVGNPTWNKGKTGIYSEETRKQMSEHRKGQRNSPSTEFKKGFTPWIKGRKMPPLTEEHKRKISLGGMGKQSGEKNPMWKGGISPISARIRATLKYRQWRSDIFSRDNFTCIFCGANNINGNRNILNADHINPFAKIIRENKITSVEEALICEELWNLNNGRTLCFPCHKKTETYLNKHYV